MYLKLCCELFPGCWTVSRSKWKSISQSVYLLTTVCGPLTEMSDDTLLYITTLKDDTVKCVCVFPIIMLTSSTAEGVKQQSGVCLSALFSFLTLMRLLGARLGDAPGTVPAANAARVRFGPPVLFYLFWTTLQHVGVNKFRTENRAVTWLAGKRRWSCDWRVGPRMSCSTVRCSRAATDTKTSRPCRSRACAVAAASSTVVSVSFMATVTSTMTSRVR